MIQKLKNNSNLNNILLVCLTVVAFIVLCYCAVKLSPFLAPDEINRVKIPLYLYFHNTLPIGTEKELVDWTWGNSYAFVPYLTSLIAYVFMKIAYLINCNMNFAMRFVSIVSVCGTMFVSYFIGKELFKKESTALLLAVLCGFLPQVIFIGSYFNNDAFSIFIAGVIIFCWIRGIKNNWSYPICVLLGIALGCMALTYYYAYGFILMSIPVFLLSYYFNNKGDWSGLIKKALVIFIISFIIAGWFFIRNFIIHNGDFLGMKTSEIFAENNAIDLSKKPSLRNTPYRLNESFIQAFCLKHPAFSWFEQTAYSFIGYYGNISIVMARFVYAIYAVFFGVGLLSAIVFKFKDIKKVTADKIRKNQKNLFIIALICTIIIPIALSMYYSYYSDYQAQGRYIISCLISLMIFVCFGFDRLLPKISEKLGLKNLDLNYVLIIFYILMFFFVFNRYFWKLWI